MFVPSVSVISAPTPAGRYSKQANAGSVLTVLRSIRTVHLNRKHRSVVGFDGYMH